MRRRLRKKKHKGEFQQCGFYVWFQCKSVVSDLQLKQVHYRFLEEAIEGNGLFYAGGLTDGIVEIPYTFASPKQSRTNVREWLYSQKDIDYWRLSPLIDVWYGPFMEDKWWEAHSQNYLENGLS